jgi:DNA-binding GntR family transcriptional regulator
MPLALDEYVLDTLMADLVGHDRQPSAFLVYLTLHRRTVAVGKPSVRIALLDLSEATGLSKRTVQNALGWLAGRRLVTSTRASLTEVPAYRVHTPWKRGRGGDVG